MYFEHEKNFQRKSVKKGDTLINYMMEGSDIYSKENLLFNNKGYLIYKGTLYDQRARNGLTGKIIDTIYKTAFWVIEYDVDNFGHVLRRIERSSSWNYPIPEKITDSMSIDVYVNEMNEYPMVDSFFYDVPNRLRIKKRYRFAHPELPMDILFIDTVSYNSKYQESYTARYNYSFDQSTRSYYSNLYNKVEYQYKKNKAIGISSKIENGRKILSVITETIYFKNGLVKALYQTIDNKKTLLGEYYYTFYKQPENK